MAEFTIKRRYMVLAGVLTFIVGVLVQAPAAMLYGWIAPRVGLPIQLRGIDGTLTKGQSEQLRYANRVAAEDIEWTLKPLGLLMAQLRYRLHSDKPPLIVDGVVSTGLGGTSLRQLQATAELRTLAAIAGQAFLPINGTASLDLNTLELREQWPVTAEGVVRVNGAAWALGKDPVPLGDFQAQLSTEGDEVIAAISTIGGSVEISGDARLKTDRSYSYAFKLKPKSDAPPMIANLMSQLGAPDAQGYYTLQRQGQVAGPVKEATIEEVDEMVTFGAPPPKE